MVMCIAGASMRAAWSPVMSPPSFTFTESMVDLVLPRTAKAQESRSSGTHTQESLYILSATSALSAPAPVCSPALPPWVRTCRVRDASLRLQEGGVLSSGKWVTWRGDPAGAVVCVGHGSVWCAWGSLAHCDFLESAVQTHVEHVLYIGSEHAGHVVLDTTIHAHAGTGRGEGCRDAGIMGAEWQGWQVAGWQGCVGVQGCRGAGVQGRGSEEG